MNTDLYDGFEKWEPTTLEEWQSKDPLMRIQTVTQIGENDVPNVLEAWARLPRTLRQQAWFEREIAAEIYSQTRERSNVPGLKSTSVGMRSVNGHRQLVGIYFFDRHRFPASIQEIEYFDLPSTLSVSTLLREGEIRKVRTVVEYEPVTWVLGQVPPNQFQLISNPAPPALWPTIQAGDVIVGETAAGFRVSGTLTAIVSSVNNYTPLLLGAQHVLGDPKANVHVYAPALTHVGQVSVSDPKLDASIVELTTRWSVDYRMKGINLVPAAPIFPYSDMAVQFTGGKSGHQTGWIDVVNSIPFGGHSVGIVPHMRASIHAQQGDSGAMLLSGHAQESPIDPRHATSMSPQYIDSMTAAMLGMLVAGPSFDPSAMTRPQVYITPILSILSKFQIQPWVR